jgi:hypothetical protein
LEQNGIKFTRSDDAQNLITKQGIGLIFMNSYKKDTMNRPVAMPIMDANYGQNVEIEYNHENQSLLFLNDQSSFVYLPLPHLNTIPFKESIPRENYLFFK